MELKEKHSILLEQAENYLRQLSSERLEVALAFLAYQQGREAKEVTEELLTIPGFAASYHEAVQPNGQEQATLSSQNNQASTPEENSSPVIAEDEEVWQAYLAVEQKWEEVFRRLADS
ncbi:hypothetical protein [Iningainema tapete]|uniref:Uncharacterized protein n=1 Tax=Iningainema tapete BLCC-T55 TaxID=2748662 RepID=A0A8J6XVX2_9CYAN|nr:hypothetical protein [Iningainema tapete]MBD2774553.1 hypothetical protein [Iningainema tapete BLCC-T55]